MVNKHNAVLGLVNKNIFPSLSINYIYDTHEKKSSIILCQNQSWSFISTKGKGGGGNYFHVGNFSFSCNHLHFSVLPGGGNELIGL